MIWCLFRLAWTCMKEFRATMAWAKPRWHHMLNPWSRLSILLFRGIPVFRRTTPFLQRELSTTGQCQDKSHTRLQVSKHLHQMRPPLKVIASSWRRRRDRVKAILSKRQWTSTQKKSDLSMAGQRRQRSQQWDNITLRHLLFINEAITLRLKASQSRLSPM